MEKNGAYPNLFSSIQLGSREIRNRVALIATLTNFGRDNAVTDRWISFLVERARGGVGLLVSLDEQLDNGVPSLELLDGLADFLAVAVSLGAKPPADVETKELESGIVVELEALGQGKVALR